MPFLIVPYSPFQKKQKNKNKKKQKKKQQQQQQQHWNLDIIGYWVMGAGC